MWFTKPSPPDVNLVGECRAIRQLFLIVIGCKKSLLTIEMVSHIRLYRKAKPEDSNCHPKQHH